MSDYTYTEHTVSDAVKLKNELIGSSDPTSEFAINGDVYILNTSLTQTQADAVVLAAGD